jgi:methyl-accepting chemotaxis protein
MHKGMQEIVVAQEGTNKAFLDFFNTLYQAGSAPGPTQAPADETHKQYMDEQFKSLRSAIDAQPGSFLQLITAPEPLGMGLAAALTHINTVANGLATSQQDTNDKLEKLSIRVTEMTKKLDTVSTKVETTQRDVTTIRVQQNALRTEVGRLTARLVDVETAPGANANMAAPAYTATAPAALGVGRGGGRGGANRGRVQRGGWGGH